VPDRTHPTVETFQVLLNSQEKDHSFPTPLLNSDFVDPCLTAGRNILYSIQSFEHPTEKAFGGKGGGCQKIGKGFFFVNMVNHFNKVLSYKKNISG